MEVDIVKYIPFGRENAIGRAELAMKSDVLIEQCVILLILPEKER